METTIQGLGLYWGYIGIMEKRMETTGILGSIEGFFIGVAIGGNIRVILGLYWDNGKENGNYCSGFRVKWYFRV